MLASHQMLLVFFIFMTANQNNKGQSHFLETRNPQHFNREFNIINVAVMFMAYYDGSRPYNRITCCWCIHVSSPFIVILLFLCWLFSRRGTNHNNWMCQLLFVTSLAPFLMHFRGCHLILWIGLVVMEWMGLWWCFSLFGLLWALLQHVVLFPFQL